MAGVAVTLAFQSFKECDMIKSYIKKLALNLLRDEIKAQVDAAVAAKTPEIDYTLLSSTLLDTVKIDYVELGEHINSERVAYYVNTSDLANEIDKDELATLVWEEAREDIREDIEEKITSRISVRVKLD